MRDRDAVIGDLAHLIDAVDRPHPSRVAIDGIDGAGKTSLADELVQPLRELGRTVIAPPSTGSTNLGLSDIAVANCHRRAITTTRSTTTR